MNEYTCPAALNIAGEHYPCQQMEHMEPGSKNHDGWAHSNRDAEAIWCSDRDPIPQMPHYSRLANHGSDKP